MKDRRHCQDYTHLSLAIQNRREVPAQPKSKIDWIDFWKSLAFVLVIFLLFAIAGSLTYPY